MFKKKSKAIIKGVVAKKDRKTTQQKTQDSSPTKIQIEILKEVSSENISSEKSFEIFRDLIETTKNSTMKRNPKKQVGKLTEDTLPLADQIRGKLWDESLANLELKGTRSSQMCKEMGVKHVRIKLPTPVIREVTVKKKIKEKAKRRASYGIIKSINARIEVKEHNPKTEPVSGPRCNESGEIISHTLLGDADSFLKEAEKRGEFQEIRDQQRKTKITVCPIKPSPRTPLNPLLVEDKALKIWHREMNLRRQKQRQLSSLLNCPESQLLMCKSDQFVRKIELQGAIQHVLDNNMPDKCFWRQQENVGANQIRCTLRKSDKGEGEAPSLSGDTDYTSQLKGRFCDPESNIWLQSDYVQQRDEELGGVIHIANSVLFEALAVTGDAIRPPKQINSFNDLENQYKGNTACSVLSKEGDISNPLSNLSTPLKGYKGGHCYLPDSKGDNSNSPMVVQKLSSEQISPYSNGEDSIRSIYVPGPALLIDGTVLRWQGEVDTTVDTRMCIIKETFILIEGKVGEVAENRVVITNCGSTVVHYNWKKLPDDHPLPIARPKRLPFYFMADEGIILPRQTIHIPLLFRSKIQGYYRQSWILTTVPVIERGSVIKFTFKGVAIGIDNNNQGCKEIEDLFLLRQGRSTCKYEVSRLVELSFLKTSALCDQLKEEPEVESFEKLFEMENPGMFYHASAVYRLEEIHKAATEMLVERKAPKMLLNNDNILSVAKLRHSILQIPDLDDEDDDDDDSMCIVQQQLLHQLNQEVDLLSYSPVTPIYSSRQQKYYITYNMLSYGIDSVIKHAHYLTGKLGLSVQEKTRRKRYTAVKCKPKVENKGKSKSAMKSTVVENVQPDSEDSLEQEPIVHSTAYKYRTANPINHPIVAIYDEQVYISMYHMLEDTLDTICDLFDK